MLDLFDCLSLFLGWAISGETKVTTTDYKAQLLMDILGTGV